MTDNIDDEVDSFFEDMLQEENKRIQYIGERYQERDLINKTAVGQQAVSSTSNVSSPTGITEVHSSRREMTSIPMSQEYPFSQQHSVAKPTMSGAGELGSRELGSSSVNGDSSANSTLFSSEYASNPQLLLQSIQRDLNRLSSSERSHRMGAMQKLKPILQESFKYPSITLYLFRFINLPLVQRLEDELELLREFSSEILLELFTTLQGSENKDEDAMVDVSHEEIQYSNTIRDHIYECLALLIPVLASRLLKSKSNPQMEEPSEEVRSKMMSLFSLLISNFDVSEYLKLILKVLRSRLEDNFHFIKREACKSIVSLCHVYNGKYKVFLDRNPMVTKLIKALSSSLTHQRHTVRSEAVLALYELVMIRPGGESLKELSKTIIKLSSDNSKDVRENLLYICEQWFINHIDTYSFQDIFITPILIMHSDELDSIRKQALESMDRLGQKHEEWNEEKLKDQLEYVYEDMTEEALNLPAPFERRPRLGSRLIVKHNLKNLVTLIFESLSEWSIQQKLIFSQLLKVVIVYCEKDITQHVDRMLQNWFKIISEQEIDVSHHLDQGIRLAGKYLDPDSYLPHIYSFLQPQYSSSPITLRNVLKVFTLLLDGTTLRGRNALSSNHKRISTELQASHLIYHDEKKVVAGVLEVVKKLLLISTSLSEEEGFDYFFLLHKTWAQNANKTVCESSNLPEILEILASSLNMCDSAQLYKIYFKRAIDLLVSGRDTWEKTSPELFTFELIVKKGIVIVPEHSSFIFSHLKTLTQKGRDGFVVSIMFSIMEHMFNTVGDRVEDDIDVIIFDIIGPNLPWTAGKSKLRSRMLGLSCLHVILSQVSLKEEWIRRLVAEYHQSIVSMLDEFDDEVRVLATKSFSNYLEKVHRFLNPKDWESCYKVLVELLDDKLDVVRVQSVGTLQSVFRFCPYDVQNVTGEEAFKKLIDTLLIHIDDLNHSVQQAVFETIDFLRHTDPSRKDIVKTAVTTALNNRQFQSYHTNHLLQRLVE